MRLCALLLALRVGTTQSWSLWRATPPVEEVAEAGALPQVGLEASPSNILAFDAAMVQHGSAKVAELSPAMLKLLTVLQDPAAVSLVVRGGRDRTTWTALSSSGGAAPGAAVVVAAEAVLAELVAVADQVASLAQLDPEIATYELNMNVNTAHVCTATHADGAHVALALTFASDKVTSDPLGGGLAAKSDGVVVSLGAPFKIWTNGAWESATHAVGESAISVTLTCATGAAHAQPKRFRPEWIADGAEILTVPRFTKVPLSDSPPAAPACARLDSRAALVRARLNGDGGSAVAGVPARPCDFEDVDTFIETLCEQARSVDVGKQLFDADGELFEPLQVAQHSSCKPSEGARLYDRFGHRIRTFEQLVNVAVNGGGLRGYPLYLSGETEHLDKYSAADVWVVGSSVHWVWPQVAPGYSVTSAAGVTVTTLSMKPGVFRLDDLLTKEEAKQLVERNRALIKPSEVGLVGRAGDSTRTSSNAWDTASPVARTLIARAFTLLNIDADRALEDGLQVLHYEPTQWYKPHVDYFTQRNGGGGGAADDAFANAVPLQGNGTNRFATVFLYLNDALGGGGETVFPLSASHLGYDGSRLVAPNTAKTPGFIRNEDASWVCNTTSAALRVEPRAASAVLFYSQRGDSSLDGASLHGSCPVGEGEKWAANLWVWNRPRDSIDKAKAIGRLQFPCDFHNGASGLINLFWDSGGSLEPQGSIAAGASQTMNTFPNHAFVAKLAESGETLGRWTMQPGVNRVDIKN
ncbi:hypothetical protein M885DRAFT_518986 [Pelagophyceae sp. CCMP2097]|nr:hypothetical protein M885DRAFT_518986 [Pelagophyceae sp. CCMP2097]